MDCRILQAFKDDFSALWQCRALGSSIEITTPFLLPDSTLLSLFLTTRAGQKVVCEGGTISEILDEECGFPADEVESVIETYKTRFGVRETKGEGGIPMYYKITSLDSLITSIAFDLANFALAVINALAGGVSEDAIGEPESNFKTQANDFFRGLLSPRVNVSFNKELPQVKGVKFSAIITSANKFCLIQYINGANLSYFRKSATEAMFNFEQAASSTLEDKIIKKVPLVNNTAKGYKPAKLEAHFSRLNSITGSSLTNWTEKDILPGQITVV